MAKGTDNRFVLVLGGARSGKSAYAEALVRAMPGPRTYLATAEALDAGMRERIERHRQRRGVEWSTIEEPVDVAARIEGLGLQGVVLLDCVTLWLTNLMGLSDAELLERVEGLIRVIGRAGVSVVAVSNDVGGGVVPDNAVARRFVDLSGLANQALAAAADEVWHVTAGIPTKIK